jgi:hypothetical protein
VPKRSNGCTPTNPDAASAQLAQQYARGGQGKKAVHYYQRAAEVATAASRAHDDMWWLPEGLRLRAAYDEDAERAVARLHEAARMAASHGSAALLARCTAALRPRGAAAPAFAVPTPRRSDTEETNAVGTPPS